MIDRDQQSFEDVSPFFGLCQIVTRPTNHHIVTMFDKIPNQITQIEQHRTAIDQGNVVDRERGLHRRVLEQIVQHDTGYGIVFEDHDDPHTLPVALVVDIGDSLDLLLVDQVGNPADHFGLVHHIGNLGHHDTFASRSSMFDFGSRPHDYAATSGLVGLLNPFVSIDDSARREIGSLDTPNQLLHLDIRIVDIGTYRIDRVGEVVRRHIGSHSDRNTRSAVDQQQRNLRRQHDRFGNGLIEVRTEIHRILFDIGHHLIGDLLHAGLRITHGGRAVAVDRTEVTLTVHQHVAHAPLLSHTHHRFVHRGVAVRVELTEHITDDSGRFTMRFIGIEVQLATHIVEDSSVHRFQSVPHIG